MTLLCIHSSNYLTIVKNPLRFFYYFYIYVYYFNDPNTFIELGDSVMKYKTKKYWSSNLTVSYTYTHVLYLFIYVVKIKKEKCSKIFTIPVHSWFSRGIRMFRYFTYNYNQPLFFVYDPSSLIYIIPICEQSLKSDITKYWNLNSKIKWFILQIASFTWVTTYRPYRFPIYNINTIISRFFRFRISIYDF